MKFMAASTMPGTQKARTKKGQSFSMGTLSWRSGVTSEPRHGEHTLTHSPGKSGQKVSKPGKKAKAIWSFEIIRCLAPRQSPVGIGSYNWMTNGTLASSPSRDNLSVFNLVSPPRHASSREMIEHKLMCDRHQTS